MFKIKSVVCGIISALVISSGVQAATFTDDLLEFTFDGEPTFPSPEQTVGTFTFAIPSGDTIVSATLEGTFGNLGSASTAPFDLFGDGVFIGQCLMTDSCFTNAVSFSFDVTNLADLLDGALVLTIIQQAEFMTRLGATTLTVNTQPGNVSPIPLPAALPLFASAFVGLGLINRRRKTKGS